MRGKPFLSRSWSSSRRTNPKVRWNLKLKVKMIDSFCYYWCYVPCFGGIGAFWPISSFCLCNQKLFFFYDYYPIHCIHIIIKIESPLHWNMKYRVIDSRLSVVNGTLTHWLFISKYGIVLMHHSLFYYLLMIIRSILIFFITITLTMIFHLHFLLLYKEWL